MEIFPFSVGYAQPPVAGRIEITAAAIGHVSRGDGIPILKLIMEFCRGFLKTFCRVKPRR